MRAAAFVLLTVVGLTAACGSSSTPQPPVAGHAPPNSAAPTVAGPHPALPTGAAQFRIDSTMQMRPAGSGQLEEVIVGTAAADGTMHWTVTRHGGSSVAAYRSRGSRLYRQDKHGAWSETPHDLACIDLLEPGLWGAITPAETLPRLVATATDWRSGPDGWTARITEQAAQAAYVDVFSGLAKSDGTAWTPQRAQQTAAGAAAAWRGATDGTELAVTWRPLPGGGATFTVTGTHTTITGTWTPSPA